MARLLWILFLCLSFGSFSQPNVPTPDHIVILIMENHSFNQIIGSKEAPYINTLATNANTALFSQSYGVTHPSQPNYISLFSGCNQGITNDAPPKKIPFSTDNLGRQLFNAGKTFISYAEDLPRVGYDGEISGPYVRRHNPAVYWVGNGTNQLPSDVIQPLTSFPENFSLLPTVCFVVPNNNNNMHNGSVSQGDKWIFTHLYNYIQWAKTYNSLFILTFDEDDKSLDNRVPTLFSGKMIKSGLYSQNISHLSILRTIEEMYHLPYACDAAKTEPIDGCWNIPDSSSFNEKDQQIIVYTNAARQSITVLISNNTPMADLRFSLMNIYGEKVKEIAIQSSLTTFATNELSAGVYIYQVISNDKLLQKRKIVIP